MGLFSNFTSDTFEEQKDTLGGFTLLDSDIYDATLKFVYANRAPSGAVSINIIADIEGTEYREIIYITNKNGENFYYSKANTSKKMPLPGFGEGAVQRLRETQRQGDWQASLGSLCVRPLPCPENRNESTRSHGHEHARECPESRRTQGTVGARVPPAFQL